MNLTLKGWYQTMARSKYSIHKDFEKVPSVNIPFNSTALSAINGFFNIERLLRSKPKGVSIEKCKIKQDAGPDVKILIIKPHSYTKDQPCVMYYHGGAFALTYSAHHLSIAAEYARALNCCVIFVDYRLSNWHPFPAGFNDCYEATRWSVKNARKLGINTDKLFTMGDSAGGALAASISQKALDTNDFKVQAQCLLYPVIDRHCKTESAIEYKDVPLWNAVSNKRMWGKYLSPYFKHSIPAYAAPGDRQDLTNSPTTYLETAEFDPLRDEGIEYANRLKQAGVAVEFNPTKGTVHGFDSLAREGEISKTAIAARINFLASEMSK